MSTGTEMCQNPQECQRRSAYWQQGSQAATIDEARSLHVLALTHNWNFRLTRHSYARELQRAVSKPQLVRCIKTGTLIQTRMDRGQRRTLFLSTLVSPSGTVQPIHFVLEYFPENKVVEVVTIYDPRSKGWMWNAEFTNKVCFCDHP